MRKKTLAIIIALIVLAVAVIPAAAITDGELDGNGHPYVGLLIFDVGGEPAWRCSGTLLSSTVVLTAGHCTDGASGARLWLDADMTADPDYPFAGSTSYEAASVHTMDGFIDPGPWFKYDAGIVILAEAVEGVSIFGELPELGYLDEFKTKRGQHKLTFDAVGYGAQKSFPEANYLWKDVAEKIRMVSHPRLIQINVPGFTGDFSLLLSNNANTGGTCFGDSGGPNFEVDSNTVLGITSFGLNPTCAGTGGVLRTDRANVQDFINGFLP